MNPINLGRQQNQPVVAKEIRHTWPVIWLVCCLAFAVVAIVAALVGQITGEQAAMACLAMVSIGLWPMLLQAKIPRLIRAPLALALVGLGLWFGFCAVGVMSTERGSTMAQSAKVETGRFLGGLSHQWEKPSWEEPTWIKPGSRPPSIPLDAVRERLRQKGRLNE